VVAPTLAVAFTWLLAAVVLLGCGCLCRQALVRISGYAAEPQVRPADLWIGLAAVVAYVEVWSLFASITSKALIAPCVAAALVGVRVRRAALRRLAGRVNARAIAVGAASALGVLWLANQALSRPDSYDSGLYHFAAIEYDSRFAAIYGLGNLQERLGAGDAHLLLVALLGNGPWHNAGFHLANGLLAAMLLGDIVWRLADVTTPPFTRRAALYTIPAVLAVAAIHPGGRLSSPSLDFPAFVLVLAGTLCLCESVEAFTAGAAMAATAAFATVAATRPQYLPATIAAGVIVAVTSPRWRRTLALVSVIPVAVVAAWGVRAAVLSGYPLFPLTIGALPVDWRVPGTVVDQVNEWVRSWARTPHRTPEMVGGFRDWFPAWSARTVLDSDVFLPLALTLFAAKRLPGSRPNRRLLLPVLAPVMLTLVLWFVFAPNPRFAYGPIWLVPILLLACRPPSRGIAIFFTGVVLAAVVIGDAWRPVTKHGDGPLGSFDPPTPAVAAFRTDSGLIVNYPLGDDRCWRVLLCTPSPNPHLRLRGRDIASGFRAR
jgi:hypothetical protein